MPNLSFPCWMSPWCPSWLPRSLNTRRGRTPLICLSTSPSCGLETPHLIAFSCHKAHLIRDHWWAAIDSSCQLCFGIQPLIGPPSTAWACPAGSCCPPSGNDHVQQIANFIANLSKLSSKVRDFGDGQFWWAKLSLVLSTDADSAGCT